MTQDDILTLARAGFNAHQIAALNQVSAKPTETEQVTPQVNPVTSTTALEQQIAQLTGMVQASNIFGAAQPKQETTDDILASIIMPEPPVTSGGTK